MNECGGESLRNTAWERKKEGKYYRSGRPTGTGGGDMYEAFHTLLLATRKLP